MKLTGGALIYGGETEEKDPYFTRKMQFDDFMRKAIPEKQKEKKLSDEEQLKKLIEDVKKRYGG